MGPDLNSMVSGLILRKFRSPGAGHPGCHGENLFRGM